jgi:hypothetical protein
MRCFHHDDRTEIAIDKPQSQVQLCHHSSGGNNVAKIDNHDDCRQGALRLH